MLRFYVHFEGSPEHTHLAKVSQDSQRTIAALKDEFLQAYSAKHGAASILRADRLELKNDKQRLLSDETLIVKAIKDRADVFVVQRSGREEVDASGSSQSRPSEEAKSEEKVEQDAALHKQASGESREGATPLPIDSTADLGRALTPGDAPRSGGTSSIKAAREEASGSREGSTAKATRSVKESSTSVEDVRAASEQSLSIPLIRSLLIQGLEAQDAQNYRQATKCFEEVLQVVPKQQICLRGLASMALAVGRFQQAKRMLSEAVEVYPSDAGFRVRLAETCFGLQQYEAAVKEYATALQMLESRPQKERDPQVTLRNSVPASYPGSNYQMGIPYYLLNKTRERKENVGDLSQPLAGDLKGEVTENEVKCGMVRALYKAGAGDVACNLVTKVLEGREDNFGMLYEYALIASENNMQEDAVRALLKLLVVQQNHRGVRESLASIVRQPGGFELLQRETRGAEKVASAQAFMASVLKDYGLVREGATLYSKAVVAEPHSVSYALNLMHAFELCNEPASALEVARNFLKRNRQLSLGNSLSLGETLDCFADLPLDEVKAKKCPGFTALREHDVDALSNGHVAAPPALLAESKSNTDGCVVSSKAAESGLLNTQEDWKETNKGGEKSEVLGSLRNEQNGSGDVAEKKTEQSSEGQTADGPTEAPSKGESPPGEVESANQPVETESTSEGSGGNPNEAEKEPLQISEPAAKLNYSPEELDVLALLFTAVKVLYLGGALGRARALARQVERARALSEKPLHETMVRNEAAYFGCIQQLFTEFPLPPLPDYPPFYLMGDSHCLTPAWRTVHLRGHQRLLTPLLVTGLKCWHLRDESVFYPKIQFENVVAGMPQHAQVIMMFGEIDCREGLVVSVNKCRYKDLEEGVAATVKIYVKVLCRLVRERGFEIFVHPPPSVLDETRSIVRLFTQVLKKKVLAASRAIEEVKKSSKDQTKVGSLHWLDFFDDYLDSEGKLHEKYKLDGTHMSPEYVELLDRELRKVPLARGM